MLFKANFFEIVSNGRTVFAAHVLAKIKIFDEIMEKSKFNYLSKELIIWNNCLKMSLFWSIYMRKQYMSARGSTWERVFGHNPIIEAGCCSYWMMQQVGKLKLTLWVKQAHLGQFTAHIQTLKTQPNSKFSISLLRPKIGYYRQIFTV